MKTWKPWTGPEERRFEEMAEAGAPARVIADELGRTYSSINNKAKELGLKLAYPTGNDFTLTRYPDEVVAAMRALSEAGFGARAIVRLLRQPWRVSQSQVYYTCKGERRQEVA